VLVIPQLNEKRYSIPKRTRMLFDAGRRFGQKTEKMQQGITGLCMASLTVPLDIYKEGILIVKMGEGNGLNCATRFYEAREDGSEIGISLLENPFLSGEEMVSPFLPAFMRGVDAIRRYQSADEGLHVLSALLHEYERIIGGIGYYERYSGVNVHS
jgi:hypothetical protein